MSLHYTYWNITFYSIRRLSFLVFQQILRGPLIFYGLKLCENSLYVYDNWDQGLHSHLLIQISLFSTFHKCVLSKTNYSMQKDRSISMYSARKKNLYDSSIIILMWIQQPKIRSRMIKMTSSLKLNSRKCIIRNTSETSICTPCLLFFKFTLQKNIHSPLEYSCGGYMQITVCTGTVNALSTVHRCNWRVCAVLCCAAFTGMMD